MALDLHDTSSSVLKFIYLQNQKSNQALQTDITEAKKSTDLKNEFLYWRNYELQVTKELLSGEFLKPSNAIHSVGLTISEFREDTTHEYELDNSIGCE